MDIENTNKTAPLPDAAQPSPGLMKNKAIDDITTEKSIQSQTEEGKQKAQLTVGEIDDLSKELNSYMDDLHTSLGFSIHEKIDNQVIVEIKNRDTGELIRQIPPEELLTIREKMVELTGLLFDQRI